MSVIEDLRQNAVAGRQSEEIRMDNIEDLKDQITSVLERKGSRRIGVGGYITLAFPPITVPAAAIVFMMSWPFYGVNPFDAVTKKVFSIRGEDDTKIFLSSYDGDLKRTPAVTVEVDGVSKLTIATIGENSPAMVYDYYQNKGWRKLIYDKWGGKRQPSLEEIASFRSLVASIS